MSILQFDPESTSGNVHAFRPARPLGDLSSCAQSDWAGKSYVYFYLDNDGKTVKNATSDNLFG
jgi:hypothetical protein